MFSISKIIFPIVVSTSLAVHANDASFVGDGATVYTTKEHRVRMAKETIVISYIEDAKRGQKRWNADCTFEFENLTDEKITLTMGFPNWKGFGDGVDNETYVIDDFKAWIDNTPTSTELKDTSKKNQVGPWIKAKNKLATFEGAYIWPVEFPAKGKVVVKNTFTFGGFSSNGPFDALDHMPPTYPKIQKAHKFWASQKISKKDIDFQDALVGAVAYITTTGQTWSGPIGEATITFQIPKHLQQSPHFMIPLPQGYHMKKDQIVWHFKDYNPKTEIALYFISHIVYPDEGEGNTPPPFGFQYPAQAKAWLKFSGKSKIDPEVVDRIIEITPKKEIKKILEDSKSKLAGTNK